MSNNTSLLDVMRRLEIAERNITEARGALNSLMAHSGSQQPLHTPTYQPAPHQGASVTPTITPTPTAVGHSAGIPANQPGHSPRPQPPVGTLPHPGAQQPTAPTHVGYGPYGPPQNPQGFAKPSGMSKTSVKPTPWWSNDKIVTRLLGIFGSVVTFVGVAFLVTLGIEYGIIGPPAQVGLAVTLGVALLAAAVKLRGGKVQEAVITALLTTSLLVLGATTMAVGFVLEWIPEMGITIIFGLLGIGFLAIAYLWNNKYALISVTGAWYFLALWHAAEMLHNMYWTYSFIGILLCALGVIKKWNVNAIVGTVTALGAALTFDFYADFAIRLHYIFLACAVAYMVVNYLVPHLWAKIGTVGFFVLACSVAVNHYGYPTSMVIDERVVLWTTFALACAWIYLKGDFFAWTFIPVHLCAIVIWGSDFAIAGIPGTTVIAILYILMLVFTVSQLKTTAKTTWVWFVWLVFLIPHVYSPIVHTMLREPQSIIRYRESLIGIALGLLVAFCIYARRRLPQPTILFGIVALVMSMVSTVTITTTIGHSLGAYKGMWLGYLTGHSVVSIAWIFIAAWLILGRYTSLGVGVCLAIAGTVKLVFLDMANLNGLPRVLAFIVSGVVLIVVATKQGKQAQGHSSPASTSTPSPQPVPVGASQLSENSNLGSNRENSAPVAQPATKPADSQLTPPKASEPEA
ncbi:MAG: hypothetical protein Q4A31_05090 [Corynebacterium sp.]|uniref:hypothetical protein n=1 Tax=Corynebacterium sp. TaxID=1720 RepID=UPI0026DAA0A7|nr:hypothetical protein [Corynebacterium sp.]MDO4761273.1 hypothetical protein [Corynebacterium sp.]